MQSLFPIQHHWKDRLVRGYAKFKQLIKSPTLAHVMCAAVIGLVASIGAIFIREAIEHSMVFLLQINDKQLQVGILSPYYHLNPWQILTVPMAGGLVIGGCYHWLSRQQQPQGIADVMAMNAGKHKITLREALVQTPLHILSIGCGGSSGREGPAVYLAAGLSSGFARLFKLEAKTYRTLLGAAIAAAVAASFNAPLAGVFFALEVILGAYAIASFAPIVMASVVGTMASRFYYGDAPIFDLGAHTVKSFAEIPAFILLGLFCGMAAHLLIILIWRLKDFYDRLEVKPFLRPALGGGLLGILALFFPQVLGLGYGLSNAALNNAIEIKLLFLLITAKFIACVITLGSGFGGGVFSPALAMGALIGVFFGTMATLIFPELSSGVTAYGILGMAAMAGALLGAPISTILMIFELTADHRLTVAVMISTVFSSQYLLHAHGYSFFTMHLKMRGLCDQPGFTLPPNPAKDSK
ncbi:MAG: chloride channel protein [Alphaproteobacteria bacterium]